MKQRSLLSLLSIFLCMPIVANQTNGLLIFLDDSETTIGAITSNFVTAVAQHAGPILASASLIVNAIHDHAGKYNERLVSEYARYETMYAAALNTVAKTTNEAMNIHQGNLQAVQAYQAKYAKATSELDLINSLLHSFNIRAMRSLTYTLLNQFWIIKEVNPSLYLLLPVRYLCEKGVPLSQAKKYSNGPLTPIELSLGLQINHLKTLGLYGVGKSKAWGNDYFVSALSQLFITHEQYRQSNAVIAIPQWSIYINGHGLMGQMVANLSIEQFKDLLSFLENRIFTRLLVYSSCYAAGMNAEKIYLDSEKQIPLRYSFPIITQALLDSPTYFPQPKVTAVENALALVSQLHFDTFFNRITQPGMLNYEELIRPIEFYAMAPQLAIKNIPQIKLPSLPWFSVLDANRKTVSIGSILAQSRTAPLDIGKFFKRQGAVAEPIAVLLYAGEIPFDLEFHTTHMPHIISMISGDAMHHIKKLISDLHDALVVCASMDVALQGPRKIFLIDEVQAPPFIQTPLTHVIVESGPTDFNLFMEFNGTIYTDHFAPATEQQIKRYHELLARFAVNEKEIMARRAAQSSLTPQAIENIQKVMAAQAQRQKQNKEK